MITVDQSEIEDDDGQALERKHGKPLPKLEFASRSQNRRRETTGRDGEG
jgi:hypothetical protein